MRRSEVPDERGVCIYMLRSLRGWTQEDLAKTMGTTASAISEYETGRRSTSEKAVRRAAAVVGIPTARLEELETLLHELRELMGSMPPPPYDPREALTDELYLAFETIARQAVKAVLGSARDWRAFPSQALESPHDLRALLESLGREERRAVVEEAEEYQTWGLCELLCEDSREAVEDGEGSALELAELALHVAERVPGDDDWRACVQAFAWAHLGHVRRDRGDRAGAEEAFDRFRQLWQKGASVRLLLIDDGRIADLEALVSGRPDLQKEA
jgi:transcriptional regulator with XRE-family HTH domain